MSVTGPPPFISTLIAEGCVGCDFATWFCGGDFCNLEQAISRNARTSVTQSTATLLFRATIEISSAPDRDSGAQLQQKYAIDKSNKTKVKVIVRNITTKAKFQHLIFTGQFVWPAGRRF
ncbi:MAG: hypothetical protein WAM43_12630 [Terriglobales bacterium]